MADVSRAQDLEADEDDGSKREQGGAGGELEEVQEGEDRPPKRSKVGWLCAVVHECCADWRARRLRRRLLMSCRKWTLAPAATPM